MTKSAERAAHPKKTIRCAIYTRKSSEEGLEQDFNSLEAQREACEAFVKSQKHEGWELVRAAYDDGGFSGGTLERPGLKRLLDDIKAGKVQVILVYKVDRLTRSLADFAKIVEVLDAQGASFVSITQQFNTTTSMGRLTLNVLLSFAQFEREVTGERIRDKIAASKKKGMWMGGLPPLGYDIRDRKLVINQPEAAIVRKIYQRYLILGSVRRLKEQLDAEGIVSKSRPKASRPWRGGKPLGRGALYRILQNRIYLGEIVHKGQSYPGEHKPVIDAALWEPVQLKLKDCAADQHTRKGAAHPSLLAGLLHDDTGQRMTPTHAVKRGTRCGTRYRYYVSRSLVTGSRESTPRGRRIPASDIETLGTDRIRAWLSDSASLVDAARSGKLEVVVQKRLIDASAQLSRRWPELAPARHRAILSTLISRVDVRPSRVDVLVRPSCLPNLLVDRSPVAINTNPRSPLVTLSVLAQLQRTGLEMRLLIEGEHAREPDTGLMKLMLKARVYATQLTNGSARSIDEIATREHVTSSYVTRVLRIAFLVPDIAATILRGHHPPQLNAAKLLSDSRSPLAWAHQRDALGFA